MRKQIFTLALLFCSLITTAGPDLAARDSVMARIEAMPQDSARLHYTRIQQQVFRQSEFAKDFTDRLYNDAKIQGDVKAELLALSAYFDFTLTPFDQPSAELALERLRNRSYEVKLYNGYFRCQSVFLSLLSSYGQMEYVADAAVKLKKEAATLGSNMGLVSAQLVLANAYKYQRDDARVVEILLEALTFKQINDKELIGIYFDLFNGLSNLRQYKEALEILDKHKVVVERLIITDPTYTQLYRTRIMNIETSYADIYLKLGNYQKVREHLIAAQKLYTPNCFTPYFVVYHNSWAVYYAYLQNWDRAIAEIETSLNRLADTDHPLLRLEVVRRHANILSSAGRWSEAVAAHRRTIAIGDSLYSDFLTKQYEAIDNNYQWDSQTIKQAETATFRNSMLVVFMIAVAFVVAVFIMRVLVTRRRRLVAQQQISKASELARVADNLKDVFVRNIAVQMSQPLEQIEQNKQKLTSYSPPQIDEFKQGVQLLAKVVDAVLELSQLEAGTLNFELKKENVVVLCYRALEKVNPKNSSLTPVEINFTSQIDAQLIEIDCDRFVACLASALCIPLELRMSSAINFTLCYNEDGRCIVLDIVGSPLGNLRLAGQEQDMTNDINRRFFTAFDGVYSLTDSKLRPRLTITIPHHDL